MSPAIAARSSDAGSTPAARRTNSAISSSVSPAEPDPHHALRAVYVDERLFELGRNVRVGVPEGRHEQHPRGRAGANEMTRQPERRRVRPVHVLEHEEQGRLAAHPDEQVGDGGVEPVPLGIGVRRGRRGERPDPGRELREEPRQLAAGRTQMAAYRLGPRVADEVIERRHVRPVGRGDNRVAVAVEHGRALGGNLAGELPHEPALAGARLTGKERRAATLLGGPGQERPQRRELPRAAREPERRRQTKRARKRDRGVRDHR
ncbi:MAG: hypothetical protein M5U27_06005 [Gaiella sp.]|nr:hypothetical protein [Gaiella sp.]